LCRRFDSAPGHQETPKPPAGGFSIYGSAINSLIINGADMTQSSRRNFLKTSAVGAAAITGASGVVTESAKAQSITPKSIIQSKANEISNKLFADYGLAIPIATKPMISSLAKGLDRTMVLGGGGEVG